MLGKAIIGFLSSLLVAVIALFVVSEYQSKPEIASNQPSTSSLHPNTISAVQASNSVSEINDLVNQELIHDKSLPIPAHQLKKLLAEQMTSKEPLANNSIPDNKALNERISKLNVDLSILDKEVSSPSQLTRKQPVQGQLATAPDKDLVVRVQHIREHLDTISQQ